MNVGDLVQAIYPFVLACGSGRYDFAVVVQVDPLVLISEQGDMLWRATLYDGCVRSVGRAHHDSFARALTRWSSEAACGRAKEPLANADPPDWPADARTREMPK